MILDDLKDTPFDKESIKKWYSDYPSNFIPKDAKIFVGVDMAAPGKDCTVRGFRDENGVIHIQECDYD